MYLICGKCRKGILEVYWKSTRESLTHIPVIMSQYTYNHSLTYLRCTNEPFQTQKVQTKHETVVCLYPAKFPTSIILFGKPDMDQKDTGHNVDWQIVVYVTLHTKTHLIKHGNLGETGFPKGFKSWNRVCKGPPNSL